MLFRQVVLFATLLVGVSASTRPATASGVSESAIAVPDLVWGYADYTLAPLPGPDNIFYTAYVEQNDSEQAHVARVNPDGSASILHTFAPLTFDSATGMYVNADGRSVSRMIIGSDGNVYGLTLYGGQYGYGTFFRLTPAGQFTTLSAFDYRSTGSQYLYNSELVEGADGAFYGFSTIGGYQFYRLAADGSYTSLCHWDDSTLPGRNLSSILAVTDGSFLANEGGSIVSLNPASCALTTIYSGMYPSNPVGALVRSADGTLYTMDLGHVYRLGTNGTLTQVAALQPVTSRIYVPPSWTCNEGGCHWIKGGWDTVDVMIDEMGFDIDTLLAAADGNLYVHTNLQGLNGAGADVRIAPDGSLTTLVSTPFPATWETAMAQSSDGTLVRFAGDQATPLQLLQINQHSSLATTASFSTASVKLWQRTTLNWSSTGAQSCRLIRDIPGVASASVATSGSKNVTLYSKFNRSPALFTAGVECTAADGNVSNSAATLTVN